MKSSPCVPTLLAAAKALLTRIDHITTDDFAHGGERAEREALRLAIAETEWPRGGKIKLPDRATVYEIDRVYLRDADVYLLASYQHAHNQRVGLDQPATAIVRVEG